MIENVELTKSLDENIEVFKNILKNHEDINYRVVENLYNKKIRICLISVIGMVDKKLINENILKPIMLTKIDGLDYSKKASIK